jgi:hypothetical protein
MPVLDLSSKTLALYCENIEDVLDDSEEQYYEEPDLSRGVEEIYYSTIYDTSNEEPVTEV